MIDIDAAVAELWRFHDGVAPDAPSASLAVVLERLAELRSLNELRLMSLDALEGKATLIDPVGIARLCAGVLLNEMDLWGAPNYVEWIFTDKDGRKVAVTTQRVEGQSPHELRRRAEDALVRMVQLYYERPGTDPQRPDWLVAALPDPIDFKRKR